MKLEDDEKELLQVKITDLLQRYQFHGASLRLAEELSADLGVIGDVTRRRQLFERALLLASVNTAFFDGFFQDRTFLSTFQSGKEIFKVHYLASLLTCSPSLWAEVIRLALLPDIDFELSDLTATCPFSANVRSGTPTPILFPSPDLFLGVTDFPTSLVLVNHLKTRWLNDAEMQETGANVSLTAGVDLSAMTHLLVSALSIGAAHCTAGPQIWNVIRSAAQENLKELLEKYGASSSSSSAEDSHGPQGCDENTVLPWAIWCESWRVRLLYYRQLSQPSLNLPDLIDEYKLFEYELPDQFRVLTVPTSFLTGHLSQDHLQKTITTELLKSVDEKTNRDRKDQCVQLGEKLLVWSEKRWKARRRFETMASALPNDNLMLMTEKRVAEESTAPSASSPAEGSELNILREDLMDEEASCLDEAKQSFHLWTEYINFEEEELIRLSEFLTQKRAKTESLTNSEPKDMTVGESVDLVKFVHDTLLQGRSRVAAQKRRAATVYMRAIDSVGDLRLDLFAAFWDFLRRAGQDSNLIPSSQWLTHWLCWCADQAVRKHSLKSCCWMKALEVSKSCATVELDTLEAFVQDICNESTGVFWKCLMAPPWFKIDEVFPPPFRLEFSLDFSIASEEILLVNTSELLHCVCEALKATEEVFRVYFSQNRLFFSSNDQLALNTDSSGDELFECVDRILAMTNDRLISIVDYLTGEKQPLSTPEGQPLTLALFTVLINIHIYRGISMARLNQSFDSFNQLFCNLDEISSTFLQFMLVGTESEESNNAQMEWDMLALIWNIKVSLLLTTAVCSDVRYFNNIKGSWLTSLLIRGDLCPRIISRTFTDQTFDSSFELLFERLTTDVDFQDLRQRPQLVEKVILLSEVAAIAAESLKNKHNIYPLFKWLGALYPALSENYSWHIPDDIPEDTEIKMLKTIQLPSPSTFPKLGAPIHIALHELQSKPFSLSQSLSRSVNSPGDQLLDLASISSSSSDSSAAIDLIVLSRSVSEPAKFTSPAPKPPCYSPRLSASPLNSSARPDSGQTSPTPQPSTSPSRRLSVEDVEKLTRATRDGREAPLPSLAPGSIPAALPHSNEYMPLQSESFKENELGIKSGDFPPARSPVLISGRKRSIGELNSDNATQKLPLVQKTPEEGENSRMEMETESSESQLMQDTDPDIVRPQTGHHHLQRKLLNENNGSVARLLGTHIEWNTLWISNLEQKVSKDQLTRELESCDCQGLLEVRLVKDYKGRSKGFAYVDFDTPEHARQAEEKMGGRSINGIKIKALISVPKNPVYEEKTVFVSNVPKSCTNTMLLDKLVALSLSPVFAAPAHNARKRAGGDSTSLRITVKKIRAGKNTDPESEEGKNEERHEAACIRNKSEDDLGQSKGQSIHRPWTIVDLRLISKNKSATSYGYVETDSKESAVHLLEASNSHPELFVSFVSVAAGH
eukprot:Gregarina_sp_Poly_1__392@NODE_1098_length_5104_cov_137_676792_g490_i1_p1_GENE_NODE_1098_length_5104_cov_137_676792_g490_i1NODE_1098_length_5104_cov_137_676792_g490_i1_p1_ORF_typecomplete_len1431_score234_78RRM_1/PF00076_22/1_1e03RRM_1/PF00076_22/9_5e13RRM_1/PF00076_22/1_9e02RRM_1/PF00076_22/12RRM_2/PF04059_12/0_65RRM_2/PF04059_12/3_7e02RRM_2/PF04059_12/96Limkainb1/PF11608_8/0_026Limkainb1/PF11608_8/4_7e03RRM_3/PF08777_11/0_076RRM_occluded/PF16842_5/0_27CFEM/PF05730_11/2_1_NODE_1098_length_5104_c